MQVIKPLCLSLSTRPLEFRKRLGLGISVAVALPFSSEALQSPLTEMTLWRIVGEELGADGMLHEGVPKSQPEYLVKAIAWPRERPARHCPVRATVGDLEKTLLAFGDRQWVGDRISEPALFESLAMDWHHAFGGPSVPTNPVGRGRDADGSTTTSLPRIELASVPIVRREDRPAPAGFGPLAPEWSPRGELRGTYDADWYRSHSPGFAPDLNWRHFNAAPADQRFTAPLGGDELYRFRNLHPGNPDQSGRLPGFGVRVLVRKGAGADAKLRQVAMSLTTLWFFPHIERLVMVFQGLADTSLDDGTDLSLLLAALEHAQSPKSLAHYVSVISRRSDGEEGFLESLDESVLMPEGVESVDSEFQASLEEYATQDLMAQAQRRGAEFAILRARKELTDQGITPPDLPPNAFVAPPKPAVSDLPDIARVARREAQAALKKTQEDIASMPMPPPAPSTGPPSFDATRATLEAVHAMEVQGIAASHEEIRALHVQMSRVEAAGRDGYRMCAHGGVPPLPRAEAISAAARSVVREALVKRLSLKGLDLTGVDLSGMDLSGGDFREATCEGARFDGCRLRHCDFSNAVLAHASLRDADASEAIFKGANLGKTIVAGASLRGAVLDGAIWMDSEIDAVDMSGASLGEVKLLQSRLGAVNLTGANLQGLTFHKMDLSNVCLERSHIDGASFIDCKLDAAVLDGCTAHGATFVNCSAESSSWNGAQLQKAVFVQHCRLKGARFTEANLDGANLRGCDVRSAEFDGASAIGADLSGGDWSGASARRINAANALWIRTRMTMARLDSGNFMNAVLKGAALEGADMRACNLYGADLTRVTADSSTLLAGSLTDRARLFPRGGEHG